MKILIEKSNDVKFTWEQVIKIPGIYIPFTTSGFRSKIVVISSNFVDKNLVLWIDDERDKIELANESSWKNLIFLPYKGKITLTLEN